MLLRAMLACLRLILRVLWAVRHPVLTFLVKVRLSVPRMSTLPALVGLCFSSWRCCWRPTRAVPACTSPCVVIVTYLLREGPVAQASASELLELNESSFQSLHSSVNSSLGLLTTACARVPRTARVVAPAGVCPRSSSLAWSALVAHAPDTTPHSTNSRSDTVNLQQPTSYNLDKVAAPNSRRRVRPSPTIGKGSAVLTKDMSHRRTAGTLHDQRQVTRSKLARSSGTGAGPYPGLGGRSGLVVGFGASLRGLLGDSLLTGGTWASSVCAEISGFGAGMWYREFGEFGC